MTALLILGILLLVGIIIVQLSRVTELSAKIRGYEEVEQSNTERQARWFLIYGIGFLIFIVVTAWYFKNDMMGYGPHISASIHGVELDKLFNTTLIFTGIVFFLTHIALFWFTYKYRKQPGRKALFFSHSTKLEILWTAVPSVVMVLLVINGLFAWLKIMPDIKPDEKVIEFEATGSQFQWEIRFPGADGKLGSKHFTRIDAGSNPLGQVWEDKANVDDFHATEIYLPVNHKVKVHINAKDVLHSFFLPHFRVKMDAVPGMPTYFIFTPSTTTAEYRKRLSGYPEWQVAEDPTNPDGPKRWETFDYELACAELCGKGHYSMRRIVKIVSEEEYNKWVSEQKSYYGQNIRNTKADPFIGQLLDYEIANRNVELTNAFEEALVKDNPSDIAIKLKNIFFETGSANLSDLSKYELNKVTDLLKEYPEVVIELSGHTDNTGVPASNQVLSEARAISVQKYLIANGIESRRLKAVGYGQRRPADTNETEEGRQNNRRMEMKILSNKI